MDIAFDSSKGRSFWVEEVVSRFLPDQKAHDKSPNKHSLFHAPRARFYYIVGKKHFPLSKKDLPPHSSHPSRSFWWHARDFSIRSLPAASDLSWWNAKNPFYPKHGSIRFATGSLRQGFHSQTSFLALWCTLPVSRPKIQKSLAWPPLRSKSTFLYSSKQSCI